MSASSASIPGRGTNASSSVLSPSTPSSDGYLEVFQETLAKLHTSRQADESGRIKSDEYDSLTNEEMKALLEEKEKDLHLAAEIGQALLAKYDVAVQDAERELDEYANQLEEKEQELYDAEQRIEQLEAENRTISDNNLRQSNEVRALQKKLDASASIASELEREKQDLDIALAKQNAVIEKMRRDLSITKQRHSSQEENNWEYLNKIHTLEGELHVAKLAERQASKELAATRRELNELQSLHESSQNATSEMTIAKLRIAYLENVEKENSQFKDRLSQLKKENQELQALVSESVNIVEVMKELTDVNKKLQQQSEMDRELLQQAFAEVTGLRAQLEETREGHPRTTSDPKESIISEIERRMAREMQLEARYAELSSRAEHLQKFTKLSPSKRSFTQSINKPKLTSFADISASDATTEPASVQKRLFSLDENGSTKASASSSSSRIPSGEGANKDRARVLMQNLFDKPRKRASAARKRASSMGSAPPPTGETQPDSPEEASDSIGKDDSTESKEDLLFVEGTSFVPLKPPADTPGKPARKRRRPSSRVFLNAPALPEPEPEPESNTPAASNITQTETSFTAPQVPAMMRLPMTPAMIPQPQGIHDNLNLSESPEVDQEHFRPPAPQDSNKLIEMSAMKSPPLGSSSFNEKALVAEAIAAAPRFDDDARAPFKWSLPEDDMRVRLSDLTVQVERLWVRLTCTDLVKLNRSMRRAFDVNTLNVMSNSLIDNIVTDVIELSATFPDVPNVNMVQHLLWDNAQLRKTLNDYSLTYVQRVFRASEQDLEYQMQRAPEPKFRGRTVTIIPEIKKDTASSRTESSCVIS